MFGEGANETYEAYNEYLSQYEELSDILSQITETRSENLNDFGSGAALDQAIREIQKEVGSSFYNLPSTVQSSYEEGLENALSSLKPELSDQGVELGDALVDSLQNGAENVVQSENTFAKIGETIAENFVLGFKNGIENTMKDASSVSQTMMGGLMSLLFGGLQNGEAELSDEQNEILNQFLSAFTSGIYMLFEETYSVMFMELGALLLQWLEVGVQERFETITVVIIADTMQMVYATFVSFEDLFGQAARILMARFNAELEAAGAAAIAKARAIGAACGAALSAGLNSAISAGKAAVSAAAAGLVSFAGSAVMGAMNAHSPSRLFMEIGSYIPQGFAIGIQQGGDMVADAASKLVTNAVAKVADAINNGIDAEPTIRPVLDLSNVESGTKRLSTMMSRNKALSISTGMDRKSTITEDGQNGAQTPQNGPVYTFNQYNTSPKALSRIEIYRQTNNQFSAFERVTKV